MQREKLIAARIKKGLSQEVAAELIGVSRNTFSQWELGHTDPYPFNIGKLCEFFGAKDPADLDLVPIYPIAIRNSVDVPEQQQGPASLLAPSPPSASLDTISQLKNTVEVSISDPTILGTFIADVLTPSSASLALGSHTENGELADTAHILAEGPFIIYEDLLIIGWECFRRSKDPFLIRKLDSYVDKLTIRTRLAPLNERANWQSLLCRFCQLATRIAQHTMNEQRAFSIAKQAIMLAIDLDDAELIASTFYQRHIVHLEMSKTTTDAGKQQKHLKLAKLDIDTALNYVELVRTPLAGNIYLTASELYACMASHNAEMRRQCEIWQGKVASILARGDIEDDNTFLKLDAAALHHEKAKAFLQFGQLHEAHHELHLAWETLRPDLFTWKMNMHLTAAYLFLAEHNIEASVKSGLEAYNQAKAIQSQKGAAEAKLLAEELLRHDADNTFVRDLATTIGSQSIPGPLRRQQITTS